MTEIRIRGEWQPLDEEHVAEVGGHMGVYELSRSERRAVVFIGYAGGRSVFGLRGELRDRLAQSRMAATVWFRCEITTTYLSRYKELLMVHVADHGSIPIENDRGDPDPRTPEPELGGLDEP